MASFDTSAFWRTLELVAPMRAREVLGAAIHSSSTSAFKRLMASRRSVSRIHRLKLHSRWPRRTVLWCGHGRWGSSHVPRRGPVEGHRGRLLAGRRGGVLAASLLLPCVVA